LFFAFCSVFALQFEDFFWRLCHFLYQSGILAIRGYVVLSGDFSSDLSLCCVSRPVGRGFHQVSFLLRSAYEYDRGNVWIFRGMVIFSYACVARIVALSLLLNSDISYLALQPDVFP